MQEPASFKYECRIIDASVNDVKQPALAMENDYIQDIDKIRRREYPLLECQFPESWSAKTC